NVEPTPEALREQALIEEARRRARRRRQGYALAALLGLSVVAVVWFRRSGADATRGSAGAARVAVGTVTAANGKVAFEGKNGTLQAVNPDGSGLNTIARCNSAGCETLEPAWSPNGKRIAFVRGHI